LKIYTTPLAGKRPPFVLALHRLNTFNLGLDDAACL